MRESYTEGLATHSGPESCGAVREDSVEALTGVRAGRVFSRERSKVRDADAVGIAEGTTVAHRYREMPWVPRGRRPRARTETPRTRTGRSWVRPPRMERRDASGRPRTEARDERAPGGRTSRSTQQVPPQSPATRGGGGGGEGTGPTASSPAT